MRKIKENCHQQSVEGKEREKERETERAEMKDLDVRVEIEHKRQNKGMMGSEGKKAPERRKTQMKTLNKHLSVSENTRRRQQHTRKQRTTMAAQIYIKTHLQRLQDNFRARHKFEATFGATE